MSATNTEWLFMKALQTMKRNRKHLVWDDMHEGAARTLHRAYRLVPARITLALDNPASEWGPLEGDWVDLSLNTAIGNVDAWELGILYPTFPELASLRLLAGKPWLWWFQPVIECADTSMHYHHKRGDRCTRPIQQFKLGVPTL